MEWLLPDEPAPVRLMNTVWADRHGVHDSLDSRAAFADWLHAVGVVPAPPRVTADDLAAAVSLRDALRRLAASATDDERPAAASPLSSEADALATVNGLLATTHRPPALVRGSRGLARAATSRPGVTGALGRVALEALDLLVAPSPLGACHAPGCVLYYLRDHPRRAWCSTGCGNRVRAARHYARTRSRA